MDIINNLPSQKGRIIIVTGANTGLGYENTLTLARKGAKVIMACRNMSKANAALDNVKREVADADVEVMEIDLSRLESVKAFARSFQAKHNRLDVLINNAGVMMPPYSKTEDNFELQFAANYLGHFLLTGLLLETIIKTEGSRIVTLSSIAHRNASINFEDLQSEQSYSASEAYGQSKLACLLFAFELQRRLEKAGIQNTISNAAHPGIATTELSRHMPKLLFKILRFTIAPLITHDPNKGAKPTILAALGKSDGGEYYGPTGLGEMKGKPGKAKATEQAKDEDLAKKLWKASEELVGYSYL